MWPLNAALDRTFDVLLRPLALVPPLWSLLGVSLVTALVMLLAIKKTSNQQGLSDVKRQIHAGVFEIRLFNDDFRAILRAQGDILRHNLTYLRLSLVPMLWLVVPFVLVIAQLQFHYGYEGVPLNQPVLVTATLRSGAAEGGAARQGDGTPGAPEDRSSLEAPESVRVETASLFFPALKQVVWRIVPTSPGDFELTVNVGGQSVAKTLHVSNGFARRSPERLEAGFLNAVLYPSEPPLPGNGPLESITIAYREAAIEVLGWELHWLIVYFVATMVFAFALRKPLRVTF
jgi:uncharacterized membrane protein (DUF106 family)